MTSKIFPIRILTQYCFNTKMDKLDFPVLKRQKSHILHPSTGVVLTKTVTPYLRHTNPTKGLSEFYPERILPMMNQTTTYCNDLLSIFSTIASIKEKIAERNNVPLFLPKRPSPYSYFALLVWSCTRGVVKPIYHTVWDSNQIIQWMTKYAKYICFCSIFSTH